MLYSISYDLHNGDPETYQRIKDLLERAGARHAQYSLWYLESDLTALEIGQWLFLNIGRPHELIVAETNPGNACATKNTQSWAALFNKPIQRIKRLAELLIASSN